MRLQKLASFVCAVAVAAAAHAVDVEWVASTASAPWQPQSDYSVSKFDQHTVYDVIVTRYTEQTMLGWGGCFGELSWDALNLLGKKDQDKVLNELFNTKTGIGLTFNRFPIGANDFARDWYSLDETPGDYALKHFSIKRDKKCMIPLIKKALAVNPDMTLWACPWSPPTWMKSNHNYATKADKLNGMDPKLEVKTGAEDMVYQDERTLDAYARYLCKFLTEYKKAGVNVGMIMFQNEPYTHNIWPNCSWSPRGIANFVGKYLGPRLRREHKDVELWHGTMNTSNFDDLMTVMGDPEAGQYFTGMGFQWEGKDVLKQIHGALPHMKMMCTENECGSGTFDWPAAEKTFDNIKAYLEGGCGAYMYFNMILKDKGTSSWGWDQNVLVRVDSKTRTAQFTPEFYLMKHLGYYVKPGSVKMKTMGNDGNMLAFSREDGSTVVFVANKDKNDRKVTVALKGDVITLNLKAKSFNTVLIKK